MKILFATDGSAGAEHAIDEALRLIPADAIEASVVGVARRQTALVALEITGSGTALLPEQERFARNIAIARAQARLRTYGVNGTAVVCEGDPAEEILAAARRLRPDLIVLGTHGRGVLGRLVMGSVSDQVTHAWDGALLVVRPKPADAYAPVETPLFCRVCGEQLIKGGIGYSGYEYRCGSCDTAYHVDGDLATYITKGQAEHHELPIVIATEALTFPGD